MTMLLRQYCVILSKRRIRHDNASVAVQQSHSAYKRKLPQAYMWVLVFVYVLNDESQQIILASGVVFGTDAQRLAAYDAGGRVGVSRIALLGVGT